MIRDRRGMTLMELAVSLAIMGMMALIGGIAFSSVIDHRNDIVRASVDTERASALRETVHGWLAAGTVQTRVGGGPNLNGGTSRGVQQMQTVNPSSGSTNQQSVTAAQAAGDEITFTTVAPNPAGSPGAALRLFVDGDNNTPETGLTLEYRVSTTAPLQRMQLDPTIGTITVEYLDNRTQQWYAASQVSTIQPRAVRVTLYGADGTNWPAMISLPMVFTIGTQQQGGAR